jgi:hypothetical protein
MSDSYFEDGGPFDLGHSGPDEITMKLPIPIDSYGMIGRECTDSNCAPGYFKVKPGTGFVGGQDVAYCPYCREGAPPANFLTKAQHQYALDAVASEAIGAIDQMFQTALGGGTRKSPSGGLFSVELSYRSGGKPEVARPVEEELRRDLICPHCQLEHAVFGLATWCPDCGRDIFVVHLEAELLVARRILGAVQERRASLGPRVAARDIENALEDVVSVFEAVLKFFVRKSLVRGGKSIEETDRFLERVVRSQFQNPQVAAQLFREHLNDNLFAEIVGEVVTSMTQTFAKRHPITHNLGIVDRKYLERVEAGELRGRDVRVTVAEVETAIDTATEILSKAYRRLFPETVG